jgi:hypothetical protein
MQQSRAGYLPPGQPSKNLLPQLGSMLWQGQHIPEKLLVSCKQQYFWNLPCHKHLSLMTCQAALKQLQLAGSQGMLVECERCGIGNYVVHGAEPLPGDIHRSYWETLAWLAVEHSMARADIRQYIESMHSAPLNALVGPHLGYVVECRVLPGWPGCVDMYVPTFRLIIQVDGQHHDNDVHGQQSRDIRFLNIAHKQRFHALRLSHVDYKSFQQDIDAMLHDCMHACDLVISRISKAHPLHQNTEYKRGLQ